jgi:hypothetical protein
VTDTEHIRDWYDIAPADAVDIALPRPDIRGPITMDGTPCPWPWEPQQLKGAPIGQYHCGHCGEMVIAGWPHTDYTDGAADDGAAATTVIGRDLDAE